MKNNLLIVHGGGPTAVINSSLYGAVSQAVESQAFEHVYAAKNGTGGLLKHQLIELEGVPEERFRLLKQTPGSAIGTSRDALEREEYERMAEILLAENISCVLFNGGNGTMDTCGKMYKLCQEKHFPIRVMGIPKTTDNDLAITDHSPGFGSAARFIAQSTKELCADVQGLPIHVVIMEASGRNAGWITAASSLADDGDGFAPDLIYLPERNFSEEDFLHDIEEKLKVKKGIVVVCSEGLHDAAGNPIVKPIFKSGRSTYFGDISSHLANLVIQKLGYKARGEKPGLLGRASIALQSHVDVEEAELAGREACKSVLQGDTGKMIAFRRVSSDPYQMETFAVSIDEVMLNERKMPDSFINEAGNGITEAFKEWCQPLIGGPLDPMISFNGERTGE